jgi:hypothetical protein
MFTEIILGLVVIVIIYLLYSYLFSSSSDAVLVSSSPGNTEHKIPDSRLPNEMNSSVYSYSVWINVDDWNYRFDEKKIIFTSSSRRGVNPEVTLGPTVNSISVGINLTNRGKLSDDLKERWDTEDSPTTTVGTPQKCVLHNIPLQKWVNLIVVLNNRALDLYLDGKLVRTCVLEGVPVRFGQIYLTPDGGFSGQTASFRYFGYPLNPRQAYEVYREGYSGSLLGNLFNKYRIKFAFMKGSREMGSLEI